MIDARVSLAMSIHARRGVYALLLGSGISREAQIPTGHEVMLDLIRRAASLVGKEPSDPEAWFQEAHGSAPTYSNVLEVVARTGSDRSNLLRQFFEPSEADRQVSHRKPTRALLIPARSSRMPSEPWTGSNSRPGRSQTSSA